ncbi:MAG: hypothetical protein Q8R74_14095 [Methylophilus sp.]|nr:hypothetical protein [Methylophilus sp.]
MDDLVVKKIVNTARLSMSILNIRQEDVAYDLQLSQSQVSRVLTGKCKRVTKNMHKICNYLQDCMDQKLVTKDFGLADINNAVLSIWDGTEAHAKVIADFIRELDSIIRYEKSLKQDFMERQ